MIIQAKRLQIIILLSVVLYLSHAERLCAQESEEEKIKATITTLFEAMALKDTVQLKKLLVANAQNRSINYAEEVTHNTFTNKQFIASISQSNGTLLERYWDPVIHIHKDLAVVWAPYDFYLDNEFHHCGVDLFSLVRLNGDWKIAGVDYTSETKDCPLSPLGQPK
jgi:hypothetical protein